MILCQALAQDKNNKDNFDVILESTNLRYNDLDLNNLKVSLEKHLMPKAAEAEKVEISEFIYLIDKALDQKEVFLETRLNLQNS